MRGKGFDATTPFPSVCKHRSTAAGNFFSHLPHHHFTGLQRDVTCHRAGPLGIHLPPFLQVKVRGTAMMLANASASGLVRGQGGR